MKRIYLLMILVVALAINVSAQRSPNLKLLHYYGSTASTVALMKDGDKMLADGGGNSKYYMAWDIINNGMTVNDTIRVTDTLFIRSGYGTTYRITMGAGGFPSSMAQKDTIDGITPANNTPISLTPGSGITQSGTQTVNYCDSVYFVSIPTFPATEASATDNRTCNSISMTFWLTDVNDIEIRGNGLMIYPNPTTYKMNIKYNFGTNAAATVDVTDVTGKVVYQKDLGKNLSGMQDISLDVNHLNSGMYFLRLSTNDKIVTEKFQIR